MFERPLVAPVARRHPHPPLDGARGFADQLHAHVFADGLRGEAARLLAKGLLQLWAIDAGELQRHALAGVQDRYGVAVSDGDHLADEGLGGDGGRTAPRQHCDEAKNASMTDVAQEPARHGHLVRQAGMGE